jgi:hypothetical protein
MPAARKRGGNIKSLITGPLATAEALEDALRRLTPLAPSDLTSYDKEALVTEPDVRLEFITDYSSRLAVFAAFVYAHQDRIRLEMDEMMSSSYADVPADLWSWLQPNADPEEFGWSVAKHMMADYTLPYWPNPCAVHQWSADKIGGNCQICAAPNSEDRIFVRFVLIRDIPMCSRYTMQPYEFTCLPVEWEKAKKLLTNVARQPKWESPRYPRNDDVVWAHTYPHFDFPSDGVLNESEITELEVVADAARVTDFINVLHVPRVTPSFIKWNIHADCERGPLGRCFCNPDHRCTVGRREHAGKELSEAIGVKKSVDQDIAQLIVWSLQEPEPWIHGMVVMDKATGNVIHDLMDEDGFDEKAALADISNVLQGDAVLHCIVSPNPPPAVINQGIQRLNRTDDDNDNLVVDKQALLAAYRLVQQGSGIELYPDFVRGNAFIELVLWTEPAEQPSSPSYSPTSPTYSEKETEKVKRSVPPTKKESVAKRAKRN